MYKSEKFKILYFPVPKVGCTTTKRALNVAETGEEFDICIHKFNPTKQFKGLRLKQLNLNKYYKFAIVRDPVERFVSIYNGRILDKKDHLKNKVLLNKFDLPRQPTIGQFINRIDKFKRNKSIDHHIRSIVDYLGPNPDFYDDIFTLKDINKIIIPKLEGMCGFKLKFNMNRNKSHGGVKVSDLTPTQLRKIKELYAKDYYLYGKYF